MRRYLKAGEDSYPPAWKALRMKAWKPDGRSWVIKLDPINAKQLAEVTTIPLTDKQRRQVAELTARLEELTKDGGVVVERTSEKLRRTRPRH